MRITKEESKGGTKINYMNNEADDLDYEVLKSALGCSTLESKDKRRRRTTDIRDY